MWVFLAGLGLGLEPPRCGVWLAPPRRSRCWARWPWAYGRGSRTRLHRSRPTWRTSATFVAGGVVTGGTVLLSGRLAESLEPTFAGLIQAMVSTVVILPFVGPASRWAAGSVRRGAEAGR